MLNIFFLFLSYSASEVELLVNEEWPTKHYQSAGYAKRLLHSGSRHIKEVIKYQYFTGHGL